MQNKILQICRRGRGGGVVTTYTVFCLINHGLGEGIIRNVFLDRDLLRAFGGLLEREFIFRI